MTPFEEMKKKAKDKKKGKNTEKETKMIDDDDDIPDGIDLNDPYFAEELAQINGGKTKKGTDNDDAKKKKKRGKKALESPKMNVVTVFTGLLSRLKKIREES